jgi:hypothetical protein
MGSVFIISLDKEGGKKMRQSKSILFILAAFFTVYAAPVFAAQDKDVNVVNTPNVNVVTMPDVPIRTPFQKTFLRQIGLQSL